MLREVSAALDSHLAVLPNLPPVAWPNVQFEPPQSGVYIAVMNMPADGIMYGMDRQQNTPGVYRINIYGDINKGPAEVENMAGDIAQHFRDNSTPTAGLFIEEINFSPSITEGDTHMLPMSINWRYFHNGFS